MWTLQYFTGPTTSVERPFADTGALTGWGISGQSSFEFQNTGASTIQLLTTDAFDNAFQFAYNARVIIWRDRNADTNPVPNFSGGSIFFQGFVAQPVRVAGGDRQNHQFNLVNWVGWAERIGFRQAAKIYNGGTPTNPVYKTLYTDEVCLGETVTELPQDVAAQIAEVITSLNQRFNPTRWRSYGGAVDASQDLIQIGTIGVTGIPMPRQPMRCVVCYEALRETMKQVPDAVLWTDYSTTPPTVNVTRLADMGVATLTLPDPDINKVFTRLVLKPRYDRQLNGVLISYKMPVTVGGATSIGWFSDLWPLNCDVDDPLVVSYVVELSGSRVTKTSTTVTTVAVQPTSVAWWQAHDDRLKNARIVPGSLAIDPASVTCVDRAGAAVDLNAFAWELMPGSGSLLPGMNVNSREVTISAKASWQRYHSTVDVKTDVETGQVIHVRIKVCDLNTNGVAKKYTTTTVIDPGEPAPTGLAAYLYNAFTALQHEGTISTVGQDVRGDVALGQKLTLVTPGNVFANNIVQSVSGEIYSGVLNAQIGPPGILSVSDIISQLRACRTVQNWKLPSGRSNGTPGGAALTALPDASAKENTIPGFGEPNVASASAPFTPP